MNFTFKTIAEFNDYFKDEKTCYQFLEDQRWNGTPVCPHCGSDKKPYSVKPRGKFTDIPSYRCSDRDCDLPFTVRTGSIFEGSKVELRKWFQAAYEITTSKKGISSDELGTRIGVSQKTAWFINHRIRQMLEDTQPELLGGMVEVDETYIGGLYKNKHDDKKAQGTRTGSADKFPVVGLFERDGKVVAFATQDTGRATFQNIFEARISKDATIVTDGYIPYKKAAKGYNHISVKGKDGHRTVTIEGTKYHTQNIENFWSQLKRGYIGIYHYMSEKHLHRYCNEFATRYNQREDGNLSRFEYVIKNSSKRKITYRELTK